MKPTSSSYLVAAGILLSMTPTARGDAVSTAFTYQDRLSQAGSPVNDTADCSFTLWDDPGAGDPPVGGNLVAGPVVLSNVSIANGLFTGLIDFGADAFDGDSRWLQIAVACPSGSALETLAPRQPLTATPYALQTRGIFVGENGSVGIGTKTPSRTLSVLGDGHFAETLGVGTSGGVYGLEVRTSLPRAVYANNISPAASATGLWAQTPSTTGRAVFGFASATSGVNFGVMGSSASSNGYAGYFLGRGYFSGNVGIGTTSPGYPLHAETNAAIPAIYGNNTRVTSAAWGVEGRSSSTSGARIRGQATASSGSTYGVQGLSSSTSGVGVYGATTASSGTTYAVRGESSSSSGYAGYFLGARNYFNGNVGLGVLNPSFRLHLSTNSAAKPTSNTWTIASDRRLKKNIHTITDALGRFLRLRGVTYQWIDPASQGGMDGTYTGMIAQEVEEVFPEWISEDKNGCKHLTVIGFEGLVVEALRELRAEKDCQLAEKERQMDSLRAEKDAQIAALEARLERIETMLANHNQTQEDSK